MVKRSLSWLVPLTGIVAILAAGCGNSESIPKHGADDQKAIDQINAMSPQERIDQINKGPMPQAAKDQMIKQIKEQNHMQ